MLTLASLMLGGCGNIGQMAHTPGTAVYKDMGSRQCSGGGISLAVLIRQLSDAGVPVTTASCGSDGRMYPAMCDAPDGRIGIMEVPEAKVTDAIALGFAPLSNLPYASKTVCPNKL